MGLGEREVWCKERIKSISVWERRACGQGVWESERAWACVAWDGGQAGV